jgi:V/A-type H+-transporting ATPase subunit I
MLQKMQKILVVGPKQLSLSVVDVLYHTGTLHLEDVTASIPKEEIRLKKWESEAREEISGLRVKIGGILRTLPGIRENGEHHTRMYEDLYWKDHRDLVQRAHEVLKTLETVTRDLAMKKSELELSLTSLARYEKTIEKISPLEDQLPVLEGYEVTVLLIQKEFVDVLPVLRDELRTITRNRFEMVAEAIDEETIAAITIFTKHASDAVHSFIFSKNVNEVRLPPEYMGKPFDEVLQLIEARRESIRDDLRQTDEDLRQLSLKWYQELAVLNRVLSEKITEVEACAKFGQTDYTFMIMGWVPESSLQRSKDAIFAKYGNRVVVHELTLTREQCDHAPTLYANPRIVRPFEFLMKLVKPPKYHEIDPSPLLAIFFPLFFGLMVGDIGYGLVILGFALFMKHRYGEYEWVESLGNIMIIAAIPTIIFGYIYGEFFGNLGELMGWLHPMHFLGITWNRIEAMMPLLIFSFALGVLHVSVGLGLGIVNGITAGKRKHVVENTGMLAAITGIILVLAGAAMPASGPLLYAGLGTVILSLPLIIYGAGAIGPLEIMGTVGNILSYARIMAIGMASVILASVANTLGGLAGVAALGILVASLLHILNIILAMFSPSLHSIRLHLVECYSKFYEGGGVMYHPFRKEEI